MCNAITVVNVINKSRHHLQEWQWHILQSAVQHWTVSWRSGRSVCVLGLHMRSHQAPALSAWGEKYTLVWQKQQRSNNNQVTFVCLGLFFCSSVIHLKVWSQKLCGNAPQKAGCVRHDAMITFLSIENWLVKKKLYHLAAEIHY